MNANIYHWVGATGSDRAAEWFSACRGVFSQDGPAALGSAPAYEIRSRATTMASASRCRQAALVHRPQVHSDGAMGVGDGRNAKIASAGDGLLIDLSQSLRIEYVAEDDNTTELTLWISRALTLSGRTDPSTLHGQVFRHGAPGISILNAAARALQAELDHLAPDNVDRIVGGLWSVATRLLPVSHSSTSAPAEFESFATICRYIETNLAARDFGIERLTRTFGLSRASPYRLFEPVGGVASYVRSRRLARARQELSAAGRDNRRIGPIAYQSGFFKRDRL
jgi:AraC-like DNA-binding protein